MNKTDIAIIPMVVIMLLLVVTFLIEEKEPEANASCPEGYFLALNSTSNQWLCGKCKTVVFGNQEYNCELSYIKAEEFS